MEEAPKSPKPTQSLWCKSKANPSPTHLRFSRGCCRCRRAFQHVCPRLQFTRCIQESAGANIVWRVNNIGREWMMQRMMAILLANSSYSPQKKKKNLPLRPPWGSHTMLWHIVPNVLLFPGDLNLTLLSPPLPQLYEHDASYCHLLCVEDCHRHLLIITVTCTLRGGIKT